MRVVLVLCLLCLFVGVSQAELNSTDIVETIMNAYDKRIAPNLITGTPTVMDIALYILEMHSISDDNMVNIFFRQGSFGRSE